MNLEKLNVGGHEVRCWGSGSGRPLLYLHGHEHHPGDAPFLRALAANRTVFAPEHPGFGDSAGLDELHDIIDLSLHYRRLIEGWQDRPVDVVGHSLGGMIAAEIAALSPHLVRRLVLVAPYGVWLDHEPAPDPFALLPDQLLAAKWYDKTKASLETTALEDDSKSAAALFRYKNLGSATKFMWPIPDRGLSRRLGFVQAPTLLVRGESDGLVSDAYMERFRSLIPDARIETVSEAAHVPMIEQQEAFVALVGDFLS